MQSKKIITQVVEEIRVPPQITVKIIRVYLSYRNNCSYWRVNLINYKEIAIKISTILVNNSIKYGKNLKQNNNKVFSIHMQKIISK
jgi:hypothetical protein